MKTKRQMLAVVRKREKGMVLVTGRADLGKQQDQNSMQWKARWDGVTLIYKTAFAWKQKSNTFSNEA